jgi:hypothetical protein
MFGIYNELDRNVAQHYAVGRAAFLFRKWMVPNINRRFAQGKYNYNTEVWEEGYYRTTGKFLKSLIDNIRGKQVEAALNWNEMEEYQKKNIIRSVTEVAIFALIASFAALTDWDDKGESSWMKKMIALQAKRLTLEIGFGVP